MWDYWRRNTTSEAGFIESDRMGQWENVAAEYPKFGPEGISYYRGVRADGYQVNCLLYRDGDGHLLGVLAHFPETIPNLERAGHGNMWVHPDHRREGVARELVLEFVRRGWHGEYKDFRVTPEGAALLREVYDELHKYRREPGPNPSGSGGPDQQ